jgi:hypothetical protein
MNNHKGKYMSHDYKKWEIVLTFRKANLFRTNIISPAFYSNRCRFNSSTEAVINTILIIYFQQTFV